MSVPMIVPRTPAGPREVASHYDELDDFYRDLWGEHVHHGLWFEGDDPDDSRRATLRLLERAAGELNLAAGGLVVDIGCGYGGSSRWLAREYDVQVSGVTLSRGQIEAASQFDPPTAGGVELKLMDWLVNDFPDDRFDAAIAIESLAHMPDKQAFFHQLYRTLKPGGRASICCWLAAPDPTTFEQYHLRRICEEGRLPGLPTMDVYLDMAAAAGLQVARSEDLTQAAARTWALIARRVAGRILSDRRYVSFLCGRIFRERIFALTIPRMMLMFATGGIRYGWLVLEKPGPQ